MQIEILLKKVLAEHHLDEHGVVQKMARELGHHRNTVARIYRNQTTNPSLDVLQTICGWLQAHGVPPEKLPQALFGSRPSALIEALAEPGRVTIYLGEYQQTEAGQIMVLWVSRRDSTLAGGVVRRLTMPGGGTLHANVSIKYVPFRFASAGSRVKKKEFVQDQARARRIFDQMLVDSGGTSTILVGSQVTNRLVELLVARLFGCQPFRRNRTTIQVPIYLGFRSRNRAMPSCFGGLTNPPGRRGRFSPGTYYLDEKGKWVNCPWRPDTDDSGIIVTLHQAGMGVQMAVLGFSGRATEAMGRQLLIDASPYWKPQVRWHDKELGVYVCRFKKAIETSLDAGEVIHAKEMEVIPISRGILERYLS